MELFHGGCHGCTMQDKHGLGYCVGCCHFDNESYLPDLNDGRKKEKDRMSKLRELARSEAMKTQN